MNWHCNTESLNTLSLTLSVISVWHDLIQQYHTCHVFWGGTLASDSLSLMDWNQSDLRSSTMNKSYAATALIILLILINLGQAGLSLSFARSFGMYFRELTMALSNVFLLALNVWNWLGSKTYYYFDLRRYVWWTLQQHWKQQLLEILILKQFWLQY